VLVGMDAQVKEFKINLSIEECHISRVSEMLEKCRERYEMILTLKEPSIFTEVS
jgi:hypothetical protein